jgi:hypothetical protein
MFHHKWEISKAALNISMDCWVKYDERRKGVNERDRTYYIMCIFNIKFPVAAWA